MKQYRSSNEREAIADWRKSLSPYRKAFLDGFLKRIANLQDWDGGLCKKIKGHPGCWELRWTAEKVEHRIFGYYDGPKVFAMLVGCTHKGKVYDPSDAFGTLKNRKAQIQKKEASLSPYEHV